MHCNAVLVSSLLMITWTILHLSEASTLERDERAFPGASFLRGSGGGKRYSDRMQDLYASYFGKPATGGSNLGVLFKGGLKNLSGKRAGFLPWRNTQGKEDK